MEQIWTGKVRGISVKMPFEPYQEQITMIEKVVDALSGVCCVLFK